MGEMNLAGTKRRQRQGQRPRQQEVTEARHRERLERQSLEEWTLGTREAGTSKKGTAEVEGVGGHTQTRCASLCLMRNWQLHPLPCTCVIFLSVSCNQPFSL